LKNSLQNKGFSWFGEEGWGRIDERIYVLNSFKEKA
jgi:hypothetical protein